MSQCTPLGFRFQWHAHIEPHDLPIYETWGPLQYASTIPALGRMASWHNGPIQLFGPTSMPGRLELATLGCIYAPSPISRFGEENDGAVGKVRSDLRKTDPERSIISCTGGREKY